ncbi:MAG: 6-bladed beta-propeller [Gemmatimonadetes bacterium]|nr:6-bladed beta-propeller [Gemmatimonadota bacterium]MYH19911.1 6-bladed beta-propeller [Gemmatimonadota bacterium]MYK99989.1 6-bladed beta-propeller [Gemmatimonadota bacterium]
MISFLRAVFLILITITVTSVHAQSYVIEKTQVIPLELGDEIVGEIADLTRDAEGNFYLPDWQQHMIWVVDSQGRLIRKIGQAGRGPGELTNPRSVALHDGKVFVLDNDNDRISTFSISGQHLSSHRIDVYLSTGMLINDDGHIAVSSVLAPSFFTVYDTDGAKLYDGGSREVEARPVGVIGGSYQLFQHISSTPNGDVLFSPVKRYEVSRLHWDGTVLATYSAEPPGYTPFFVTPTGSGFKLDNTWSRVDRPMAVGDHVLIQRWKVLEDGEQRFKGDLFLEDGSVVQLGIELPFTFICADGRTLYGIDTTPVEEGEPNPHITVYRLSGGPE